MAETIIMKTIKFDIHKTLPGKKHIIMTGNFSYEEGLNSEEIEFITSEVIKEVPAKIKKALDNHD